MSQGSRDGVMLAFKGGRVPILVATDVAARGLDISTVTHVDQLRRAHQRPTPTCTASGAPAAWGARVARSRSSRTRQKRELEAIERHIGTNDRAVGARAPRRAPTPVRERPRRHSKPRISRATRRALRQAGARRRARGGPEGGRHRRRGHLLGRPRRRGGARRDRARALLVPVGARVEADRVIEALDGREMGGRELSLERCGLESSRPVSSA